MRINRHDDQSISFSISDTAWRSEMEKTSKRYHLMACWAAIIFDPIFAFTDYLNIPEHWAVLFFIRLGVSACIGITLLLKERLQLSTHAVVSVPFLLISLQNAFTFSLIGKEDLLGHNLNYMALLVGAAMFVLWHWGYSVVIVIGSAIATFAFVYANADLSSDEFFLNGGLLLAAVSIFMIVLIQTRYQLTSKEIKARLALQLSKEEIQSQSEEIKSINDNLEDLVEQRTRELEQKNKALEEAAFINAHKLRSPVASILGLLNLLRKSNLLPETKDLMDHMSAAAMKLDTTVKTITRAIEKGESIPEQEKKNRD
jgi:signal transduction histidine kinase